MIFTFISNKNANCARNERPVFHVQQIWRQVDGERIDVSHLIDRTYEYQSVRELHWHLADRFLSPVRSISLSRM
ncbi:hypothetical protein [Methylobacterium sp. ID0610]|uniref:hypothetical protein n=1 Tax=Methylobacterium carpenticola TaxID=3344827 RepID=UPI0036BA9778